KALYKYPQRAFPYAALVRENRSRGRDQGEFEIADTGVFDDGRFFDVVAEYAKASPDDLLIRLTVSNRGPEPAPIHVLPTLWFRNTWSWGRTGEGYWEKPSIAAERREARPDAERLSAVHATLGTYVLAIEAGPGGAPELLFTDNETNAARLFGGTNAVPYVKDAFHEAVVAGQSTAV